MSNASATNSSSSVTPAMTSGFAPVPPAAIIFSESCISGANSLLAVWYSAIFAWIDAIAVAVLCRIQEVGEAQNAQN